MFLTCSKCYLSGAKKLIKNQITDIHLLIYDHDDDDDDDELFLCYG